MSITFELLREDDLLVLRVDTVNLKLDTSDAKNPKLVPESTAHPAYLIVQFPPQSILERAYLETENNGPGSDKLDAPGSVPVRMAGGSRLVFKLPSSMKHLPFNMNALLDWSKLEMVLSPTAQGQPVQPPIVAPTNHQTALEIPYRTILSPSNAVGWLHAKRAVTHAGRSELWHTRLGKFIKVKTKSGTQKKLVETDEKNTVPLRVIWSPDFVDHVPLPSPADTSPFPAAMTRNDRAQLVILTSGVTGYFVAIAGGNVIPWVPKPIQASRLFLSSLGGWLSSRGVWPAQPSYTPADGGPTQSLDLSEWDHIATQGRDHYVRIVKEGFLYPFGHRAAFITVSERKVVPADNVSVPYATAYLKQYKYVIVREKEKTYPASSYKFAGREMPLWRSVRIRTLVTPYLDNPAFISEPAPGGGGGTQASASFWIEAGGTGFPFHLTGIDLSGKSVNFLASLIFMDEGEQDPAAIQSAYKNSGSQRACSVSGQKVAYADPSAGDTTLKTDGLFFDAEILQNTPPYTAAPFVPCLDQAAVTVPALEQILGTTSPITVQLYSRYLSSGIDGHAAVFAQVSGTPPAIQFSADKAGGFSTPNLALTALSAKKGLIAGSPDDAANGLIKPTDFFDVSAKLFGTVPLQALIPVDSNGEAPADQNAPEIRSVLSPNSKNPDTLTVKLSWSPQLAPYEKDPVKVEINQNGGISALTLKATLSRSLKGGPPQSDIQGELSNFQVSLLGVFAINFNSLKFSSKNGQKLIVKADLPATSPITFIGPLEFVQKLADILPPGLFGGKGPSIDLKPDKIRVSYTLGLPPISVGVFSLEHIAIMAGIDLPYLDGKPEFEFAFASRGSPFLITVECLGGGGFVHLVVDADGVQMVEGALEFGGEFSLDLGVASGGVHIMAGIYFKLSGTDSDLTGFVDVGGEVSVLGIISVSLDLNLSLSYEVQNGKKYVDGKATMTVAVHVLFFSASVSITMEKKFKADSGDPGVGDVLNPHDWDEFAKAFGYLGS
jgi:hypothetical protein